MNCLLRCVALGVPPLKGGGNPTQLTQTLRTTLRNPNAVPRKRLRNPNANLTHEVMLNPTQNRINPTQPYADKNGEGKASHQAQNIATTLQKST